MRGQDGEDGLAAGLHGLVQHVVHLVHRHQSGRAEDGHHGINVVQLVFAIIQAKTQLFGRARGQDVDGISYGRTGQQLSFQLVDDGAFQFGNVEAAFAQGIGQHHAGASGMGDNGKVTPFQFGQGEDAAHGGQLLTREAAHDTCLAEQGFDGRVAAGYGTRMRRGGAASAFAAAGLDGGNAAALLDERRGVEQQAVGVADVFDVEQFDVRVGGRVEVLVHVLQHVFHADLLGVAHRPYGVELQAFGDGAFQNEDRCGT